LGGVGSSIDRLIIATERASGGKKKKKQKKRRGDFQTGCEGKRRLRTLFHRQKKKNKGAKGGGSQTTYHSQGPRGRTTRGKVEDPGRTSG